MKIKLSLDVYQRLLAYAAATRMEYSGFGFCDREPNGDIFVYDFVLMDVGNEGYTEINPKRILPLMDRPDRDKMRLWAHRHPINGWSSRDLQTILKEPLGSTPEAVGWSVSVVLTPSGFIGRIDNYLKGITKELEVEPNCTNQFEEIRGLQTVRQPFHPGTVGQDDGAGVLADGLFDGGGELVDYEDWDDEDEEIEDYDIRHAPGNEHSLQTVQEVLAQLATEKELDPQSTSFASICDDWHVDWWTIREREKKRW